jgi:hypothetical protein
VPKGPDGQKYRAYALSGMVGTLSGVISATIASKFTHPLAPLNFVIYVLVGATVGLTALLLVKYRRTSGNGS